MSIKSFYNESMINKLLVINTAVYLLLLLAGTVAFLLGYDALLEILEKSYLELPAEPKRLLLRIWTPITYMFTHTEFWNYFCNMLWLFFMGRLFTESFNNRQTLGLYLLGGLSGALLFIAAFNILPIFHDARQFCTCIGASAAITAIVIAICVARPSMEIRIFGIFPLTLKWLGILYVLFDLLSIRSGNPEGHIAHLGGAAAGALFAIRIRKGSDITAWLNKIIDMIVSIWPLRQKGEPKAKMNISYMRKDFAEKSENSKASSASDADSQRRVDEILDKISKTGYNNLTREEKEFLFKMSRK